MKNNEYNIVNITNEKNNFSAEYTKAQKVEYSFQPENKNPIKDELNDRHTINDNVEENVSKSTKEKEKKKREDAEKIESSTSSSSAASSGASAAIVAATTVAVVSVGAIVGINVINPTQEVELATFLTSEITPNSIDFSFSMPSKLLRYEEEEGQDGPISEKNVVFTIANGSGFNIEEYLVEYEEYDEEHFIYYGHMGGLTPDTSYALTVSIKEENPETEIPSYRELGRRTFFTESIPVTDDFRFETIEATTTKVYFSFVVSNSALEYNPGQGVLPIVNATITSNYGYEDTISIEQLTEYDKLSMIGSGNFTGLTPLTTYTITISAELESGYKSFGYTPVTTENALTFDTVEPTYNSVNFSFIVDNEAVEYDPALARKPAIQATISDGGSFYDEMWVEQISTYDDSNLMGSANFTGLSANTEYTITLSVSLEQELRTLGSTTFTTGEFVTGFEFLTNSFVITSNSITFAFDINEEQVDTSSSGSSNIAVTLTIGADYVDGYNVTDFTASTTSGKLTGSGTFRSLSASTTYTITISNGTTGYTYGSTTVTTSEATTVFNFLSDQLVVGYSYISFAFEISESEVEQASGSSNINALLESEEDSITVNITSFEESSTSGILIGRGAFTPNDGVTIATSYTLSIVNSSSTTYGSTSVRTMKATIGPINTDTEGEASFAVYVDSNYVGYVEGSSDLPSISASAVRDGEEYATTRLTTFSTYSSSVCKADGTITGLEASTTYMLYLYYNHDGISEVVANKEFTSKEASPTFYFAESQYQYIGDDYISPLFYIKKTEVQEVAGATASGSNINVSISGGMAYTQTVNIAMSDFSDPQDNNYYMARPTFENLDSNIEYTIVVSNTITGENYGSSTFTTTDSRGIGFVVSTVTPATNNVQASFYLNTSYVSDTNNVSATVITKDGTTVSSAPASLTGTEDNKYEFSVNVSGLSPQIDYIIGFYYSNTLVGTAEFTTEEYTGPSFNGATIPTEVSFYSHEFSITLDFVDDPSSPQYDNLSIQFYSGTYEDPDRYTLGSSITLQSITNPQTLLLPSMQDGGESYYEFDFDQIGSYDIFADQAGVQTSVYHADITFSDTDEPGVVNGLNSDYLISIDASTGEFILPVQLLYTDDYDKLMSFYVELCPTDGTTPSISAGASKEEDYQNLVYSGNDATSVISYIQNGGADGAEFNVKIYHFDDQSNPIWESSETVNIKVADTNIVYGGTLFSTELSEDNTTVGFSLSYVNPVSTPTNPQIQFVDSSDSSLVYSYDFNFENYPSIDMTNPAMSTGSTITDYASLKAAFEGKTFTVIISYYDGTTTTTKTIQTGVSFTFA